MTLSRPLFTLTDLQHIWPGRLSLFRCHSIRYSPSCDPTIGYFLIPGFSDPLWPAKLKNGHFWVFLEFWTIKKYANGKIGDSQIEWLSTSFNLIPNLSKLDRAPLSYGPGSGRRPENFALTLFGAQIR